MNSFYFVMTNNMGKSLSEPELLTLRLSEQLNKTIESDGVSHRYVRSAKGGKIIKKDFHNHFQKKSIKKI